MSNALGHVTETRVERTKVTTAQSICCMWKSKPTAQDHRSGNVKAHNESSVTSLTFANITCREIFWVLTTRCPCCLPVAPNYTIIF